jgi:HD-like signal output (HDOD) protein
VATKNEIIDFQLQKLDSIPSLPNIVMELIKLVDNPMASTRQVEELLSKDQGITLRVLRLANSAYYAIPGGAKTVGRAITYLGMNTVKQIVLSASVFDAFKKLNSVDFSLMEFWKHSFGVGVTAEVMAKHKKIPDVDEVFVCGLIHDVGKLALLMVDPKEVQKTLAYANEKSKTMHQAEMDLSAPEHAHWGAVLAKKWKLPVLLQSAVQYHHTPNPKARVGVSPEASQVVDIVIAANYYVHSVSFGRSGYSAIPAVPQEVFDRLMLQIKEGEEWIANTQQKLSHAETMVKELFQ